MMVLWFIQGFYDAATLAAFALGYYAIRQMTRAMADAQQIVYLFRRAKRQRAERDGPRDGGPVRAA